MPVSVRLKRVKLEKGAWHFHLKAHIEGISITLLLDTGASHTVLDKDFYASTFPENQTQPATKEATGFGSDSIAIHQSVKHRLGFGKMIVKGKKVAVADLSHVNAAYKAIGVKPIQGVLGSDVLVKHKAIIELQKSKPTLILTPPKRK